MPEGGKPYSCPLPTLTARSFSVKLALTFRPSPTIARRNNRDVKIIRNILAARWAIIT
jgi:hypothetical protein